MVKLENVSKYYKNLKALRSITLNINKGEMVFLAGSSGAGKSTLLKLIYMAEKPDEGYISVAGFDISHLKESSIPFLRRNIGFVFQDFKLLSNRTVFDNVALALRIRGFPESDIREKVFSVLKMVNLRHKSDSYPLELSGGEQQRITFARAVIGEPSLMLADEPTGNLDIDNEEGIMRLFKEINAKGTTILIATHNRNLFLNTGKRVFYLDNGNIVREERG